MHIQWIDIRKSIIFLVKPFTIAQPYFSALLIGFLGILSVNYVQSKIAYYEKIANKFEDKVILFQNVDETIRIFSAMDMIYTGIYTESNVSTYSREQTYNQLAGQMQRAEILIPQITEVMLSLDKVDKFLEQIAQQSSIDEKDRKNFLKISIEFHKDNDDLMSGMMYLDEVFIPYANSFDICMQNNNCDYKNLLVSNRDILMEYNKQSKKMNSRIESIIYNLSIKQKEEAYKSLIVYWLIILSGLYICILIYSKFIKLEEPKE